LSIGISCAIFDNRRLLLNHDLKNIIKIRLWNLNWTIATVNVCNLNMNKLFQSIECIGHVFSIILNIINCDSPVVLAYVAEVVNGTGSTNNFFHIHRSKLDIVAVVGIVQWYDLFFYDTLVFQCLDYRLLILRWCKTHHTHFRKGIVWWYLIY